MKKTGLTMENIVFLKEIRTNLRKKAMVNTTPMELRIHFVTEIHSINKAIDKFQTELILTEVENSLDYSPKFTKLVGESEEWQKQLDDYLAGKNKRRAS